MTAFPPQRDGVADYSFYLIKSIEEASDDCAFYVMAPLVGNEATAESLSRKTMLLRMWRMKSIRDVMMSEINLVRMIVAVEADILHVQYRFTRAQGGSVGEPLFLLMIFARLLIRKLKIVVSLHDFWLPEEAEQRVYEVKGSRLVAKLYRLYYEMYVRTLFAIPNLIINIVNSKNSPVTESVKKYAKREVVEILHGLPDIGSHYDAQNVSTIHTKCETEVSAPDDCFTILLFGFIRKAKAYHYVIKAIGKILASKPTMKGRIKLLIAGLPTPGEQSYLGYLKQLVEELNLRNSVTIIAKFLDANEISRLFRVANITVVPYERRVGPSGVLSFALAYNLPAIITCDNKYITRGMKFPAFLTSLDEDEIASTIFRLISNPYECEKQVELIKKYKEANTNRRIALSHVELYKRLYSDAS